MLNTASLSSATPEELAIRFVARVLVGNRSRIFWLNGVSASTPDIAKSRLYGLSPSPGWGHFSRRSPLTLGSHVWAMGAHLLQARVLQRALQCRVCDDGQADETIFPIRRSEPVLDLPAQGGEL